MRRYDVLIIGSGPAGQTAAIQCARNGRRVAVVEKEREPGGTSVHYIAVHLHPFAESLELRDWTTGETVFKSTAHNRQDQIGLRHVESYASPEGIRIHPDHGYELVAVYDNTSGEPQDSMAVMFLYAADPLFQRPVTVSQNAP